MSQSVMRTAHGHWNVHNVSGQWRITMDWIKLDSHMDDDGSSGMHLDIILQWDPSPSYIILYY